MKRLLILTVLLSFILIPFTTAQEKEEKLRQLEQNMEVIPEEMAADTLTLPDEEFVGPALNEAETQSQIKLRNRVIIEDGDSETIIRIGKKTTYNDEAEEDAGPAEKAARKTPYRPPYKNRRMSFTGHLGGVELGYNNYTTGIWMENSTPVDTWLNLNTGRSLAFNLVSPPVSLGLTPWFGFVTALGLNFNNYHFDGNNSVTTDNNGVLTPLYPALTLDKSKLTTVYAFIPVILELQLKVSSGSTLNLGGGVIGALRTGSYTKMVYISDEKHKEKNHGNFGLNMLRYGFTARAGYQMINVYGTFYMTPLFEEGKGPELYPYEIGLSITFNN